MKGKTLMVQGKNNTLSTYIVLFDFAINIGAIKRNTWLIKSPKE